jgi:hypothetical protein
VLLLLLLLVLLLLLLDCAEVAPAVGGAERKLQACCFCRCCERL